MLFTSEKNENYNLHLNLVHLLSLETLQATESEQSKCKFAILHFSFVPNFLLKLCAIVLYSKDWFEFVAIVIRKGTRKEMEILKFRDPLFFFFTLLGVRLFS